MDKHNFAAGWVATIGYLIIVQGVLQLAITPFVMNRFTGSVLMLENSRLFAYVFMATGAAMLFAGWVTLFAARGLRRAERWAWTLAWRTSLFLLLLGLGASVLVYRYPPAHLLTLFAALQSGALLWYRPVFQPRIF